MKEKKMFEIMAVNTPKDIITFCDYLMDILKDRNDNSGMYIKQALIDIKEYMHVMDKIIKISDRTIPNISNNKKS